MAKKESTKEVILKTATCLFQRQGYHGTGLNQIIEESGAPKGSIYYHFPNGKEEIALEAIHQMKRDILERAQEDLSEGVTAVEAFQFYINKIASIFDHPKMIEGLSIGLIASEIASTHENLRLACEAVFKDWQALYVNKLKAHGMKTEKAEELGLTITALIEGACTLSATHKNGDPLRVIAKQLPLLLS